MLLMVEGTSPPTMGEMMQKALREVETWAEVNGLTFNPSKTQAMLCLRARGKLPTNPVLKLRGKKLTYSENIKYLGVLINRRLIWSHHIRERYKKCVAIFHKTKALIARDWGLAPRRVLWVYQAIVLPKLTYGAIVWGHEVKQTVKKWLYRLQRLALSQILRPWRSTATESLDVIAGILPVDLRLQELAMKARLRIASSSKTRWDGISDKGKKMGHRRQ